MSRHYHYVPILACIFAVCYIAEYLGERNNFNGIRVIVSRGQRQQHDEIVKEDLEEGGALSEAAFDLPLNRVGSEPGNSSEGADQQQQEGQPERRDDHGRLIHTSTLEGCPRYLFDHPDKQSGLGHRFAGMLMALKTAKAINATVILDPNVWASSWKHGEYPLFWDLFGLDNLVLRGIPDVLKPLSGARRYQPDTLKELLGMFEQPGHSTKMCNVVIHSKSGQPFWCAGEYCFRSNPGLFNELTGSMRQAVATSDRGIFSNTPDYFGGVPQGNLVVVWHVRTGDLTLHSNQPEFFINVLDSITRVGNATGSSFSHFVLYGGESVKKLNLHAPAPSGFKDLGSILPDVVFIASENAELDVYKLSTTADILVGSGSSFTIAAAAITPPSELIHLPPPPKECTKPGKEGGCPEIDAYRMDDDIELNLDGTLSEATFDMFLNRVMGKRGN